MKIIDKYSEIEEIINRKVSETPFEELKEVLGIKNDSTARNKKKGYNKLSHDDLVALTQYFGIDSNPLKEVENYKIKISRYIESTVIPKAFFLESLGGKNNRYLKDRLDNPALWSFMDLLKINSSLNNLKQQMPCV